MARLRTPVLALLLAMLAIAGCGGGTHKAHKVPKVHQAHVAQVAGHACKPNDLAMQCVLAGQPPPRVPPAFGTTLLHGIDFAWTKFPPSQVGDFAASYASYDSTKDWSASLVRAYHAAHKGTVVVFETSAERAKAGCGAGISDATRGEALLASWGYPRSHLDMAIDFDATGPDVAEYFRCANNTFPGLIGDYGGALPTKYLCSKGYVHKSWATYAWLYRTGHVWPSTTCAPLRQVLNGSTFDHDIALAPDYGQFPTPTFGPSRKTIENWRWVRNHAFARYRETGCKHPQGKPTYCGLFGGLVVSNQAKLWTVYKAFPCFGRGAHTKALVCWIVRPQASYWSHAAASTARAMDLPRNACNGPISFPAPGHTRTCNTLRQRRRWFREHATALVKAYS